LLIGAAVSISRLATTLIGGRRYTGNPCANWPVNSPTIRAAAASCSCAGMRSCGCSTWATNMAEAIMSANAHTIVEAQ